MNLVHHQCCSLLHITIQRKKRKQKKTSTMCIVNVCFKLCCTYTIILHKNKLSYSFSHMCPARLVLLIPIFFLLHYWMHIICARLHRKQMHVALLLHICTAHRKRGTLWVSDSNQKVTGIYGATEMMTIAIQCGWKNVFLEHN